MNQVYNFDYLNKNRRASTFEFFKIVYENIYTGNLRSLEDTGLIFNVRKPNCNSDL